MHDLSKIEGLKPLARLVDRVKAAAGDDCPFVIAGAQARDLLLKHAYKIETGRQTADVDFAFRVNTWDQFHDLRTRLIDTGDFVEVPKNLHKLKFKGTIEVDIVPFGNIEAADRTISWPPNQDFKMSLFGFQEVFRSTVLVHLPENVDVSAVSLSALALLKLEAWRERRLREPGKDAHDLKLILNNYLGAGNHDRLYTEFLHLLDDPNFDYVLAGAHILGHDIAQFLDEGGKKRVGDLIAAEVDPEGKLRLVGDMRGEAPITLLGAMQKGFLS